MEKQRGCHPSEPTASVDLNQREQFNPSVRCRMLTCGGTEAEAGFQDHVGTNSRRLAGIVHFHRRTGRDLRGDLSGRTALFIDEPDACRHFGSSHLLKSSPRSGQTIRSFVRDGLAFAAGLQCETISASRSIEQSAFSATG